MIEALGGALIEKKNLANASDTVLLQQLLASTQNVFDAKDAGTTFRFLTAYLAWKEGSWLLTGSERMKERPIGDLVDALRSLGAEIRYVEKEGFPPLEITGGRLRGNSVRVSAAISSQFISALLMIAPCLPNGLIVEMDGAVVSEPYIKMTLSLMAYFGIAYSRKGNIIHVPSQLYRLSDIFIESDWSAASYFYEMASFASEANIELNGLLRDSFQGDSAIAAFMKSYDVETRHADKKVILTKREFANTHGDTRERDAVPVSLNSFPDLAPALFVAAAGTSHFASFTGLAHLAYKESNREQALKTELGKCGIHVVNSNGVILIQGKFVCPESAFETYKDHRIAMCLAPLAMLCGEVKIIDPLVVNKSYPAFWNDLQSLGFEIKEA